MGRTLVRHRLQDSTNYWPWRAHNGVQRPPSRPVFGRRPILTKPRYAEAVIHELRRLQAERHVEWLAWVLMPDHLHALASLAGELPLSRVMQRVKGGASRTVGESFWLPGFHDHALRSEENRIATARYIVANPVRAGLVDSLRDWRYWYCTWFARGDDPDELLRG